MLIYKLNIAYAQITPIVTNFGSNSYYITNFILVVYESGGFTTRASQIVQVSRNNTYIFDTGD